MAIDNTKKHANFVARSVNAAQQFILAYNQLVGLRAEWDAQGYSSGGTAIVDSDFSVVAPNSGSSCPYMAAADLAAFYTSQANLVTYWTSGNGTNICKLIP